VGIAGSWEDELATMLDEFERYKQRMQEEICEKKVKLENLKHDIKYKIETVFVGDKSGYFTLYLYFYFI
jgi:hypothetical protein